MTLGSLLATANASAAAAPVMPMAAPSMIVRTRPSTREVPVPSASHTVVRATDLPDMGAIVLSALRVGVGATVRLARHGADARVATAAADRPPHAGDEQDDERGGGHAGGHVAPLGAHAHLEGLGAGQRGAVLRSEERRVGK